MFLFSSGIGEADKRTRESQCKRIVKRRPGLAEWFCLVWQVRSRESESIMVYGKRGTKLVENILSRAIGKQSKGPADFRRLSRVTGHCLGRRGRRLSATRSSLPSRPGLPALLRPRLFRMPFLSLPCSSCDYVQGVPGTKPRFLPAPFSPQASLLHKNPVTTMAQMCLDLQQEKMADVLEGNSGTEALPH